MFSYTHDEINNGFESKTDFDCLEKKKLFELQAY